MRPATPASRFLALCLAAALAAFGAAWYAASQLVLGVRFEADATAQTVLVAAAPEGSGIPVGATAVSLAGGNGNRIELIARDLIEDPDYLDAYEDMEAFFARQGQLADILSSGKVVLAWRDAAGPIGETRFAPLPRGFTALPFSFWFQIGVALAGLSIAGWFYFLRPRDWGVRLFGVMGLALAFSASSAAIYSTRELAVPEAGFRLLSAGNHFGATVFGMALVALFVSHPRPLWRPVGLLTIPAVFVPWFLADQMRWAPNLDWGVRIPLFLELVLACGFALAQWRMSRHDPLARAALRWLALSILLGCSLFLVLVPGYSALGLTPSLSQSYAFGFFLIMYLGIALGLRRYRLFDIDEWAYRILLWAGGAMAVIALDVVLLLAGLQQVLSLGVSLLIAGWLYFPFRQWLWRRLVRSREPRLEDVLPQLSEFAFLSDSASREAQWDAILRCVFDPLDIRRVTHGEGGSAIQDDGLALRIPAIAGLAARELRHATAGSRLFSSRDARFAEALRLLAGQILSHRESFELGAREERQRLARDLHDNLGARILRLIHHLRGTPDVELAREAMKDLRIAIAAIDAPPASLGEALDEWRAEIEARCAEARVDLVWSIEPPSTVMLSPRIKAALGSALREAITNALKHAHPRCVMVSAAQEGKDWLLRITNDGVEIEPEKWQEGYGLRNIRARLHDLGGTLDIAGEMGSVRLTLRVPLANL